jgi:hypothetical protein
LLLLERGPELDGSPLLLDHRVVEPSVIVLSEGGQAVAQPELMLCLPEVDVGLEFLSARGPGLAGVELPHDHQQGDQQGRAEQAAGQRRPQLPVGDVVRDASHHATNGPRDLLRVSVRHQSRPSLSETICDRSSANCS